MTEQENLETRRRRSRAEVEQLVAEFHGSGATQRQFCLNHRLALSTLQRYLHIGSKKRRTAGPSRLMAVEVADSNRLGEPGQPEVGSGLALIWAEGRKLEVQRGFDEVTLERLLQVLERR
jgi:hypothetical protein